MGGRLLEQRNLVYCQNFLESGKFSFAKPAPGVFCLAARGSPHRVWEASVAFGFGACKTEFGVLRLLRLIEYVILGVLPSIGILE